MSAARVKRIAITGRFQPFHLDHLKLVRHGLGSSEFVVIGITNPDRRSLRPVASSAHRHRPNANPFTFWERLEIITAALLAEGVASHRFRVVPFPLDEPEVWFDYIPQDMTQLVRVFSPWENDKVTLLRDGGYAVDSIDGDPSARISASTVRSAMAAGEPWQHWLPPAVAQRLEEIGADELARRCL